MSKRGTIEHFLTDVRDTLPDPQQLAAKNLEAYAYTHLPTDHPEKKRFKSAFLAASVRHQLIKAELLPLVRAWYEAGLEVLLLKGFYFAEFVYPSPGSRFYGDVDVLVHAEDLPVLTALARGLGWSSEWLPQTISAHAVAHFFSPGGQVRIDVHRFVNVGKQPSLQRRFTEHVWRNSGHQPWQDLHLKVLAPLDALLVGLILARCWSGDQWGIKPHDYLDARFLMARLMLTQQALEQHAQTLGCERSLAIFLARCNPWQRTLDLRHPTVAERHRWYFQIIPERGYIPLDAPKICRAPGALWDVMRSLPQVLWVLYALRRRQRDLDALLQRVDPGIRVSPEAREVSPRRTIRGVNWACKLLLPRRKGVCLLRSLALFRILRLQGYAATFVSGVRKEKGEIVGHAWVELNGRPLEGFGDQLARRRYKVNICYPSPGKRGAAQVQPLHGEGRE